jgi:cyclomaltodextrinase
MTAATGAPGWVKHAVWWHVYPLGFVGAEIRSTARDGVTHRLGKLTAWLDYAVELGASGLMLGPMFAASTHGYDTIDYFRIDPRLGDEDDFDQLVRAAHDRGLRIVLDGVFNHVGCEFPFFQQACAAGPDAPEARWFKLSWPCGWRPGVAPDYATFEGHHALVALNHSEPAVADYVVEVMNYWLDRGADGWRLDAAYAVAPSFWQAVLPRVRVDHPNAYLFGEVLHGDYARIVRDAGFDAVTQYELWKAIWSSLNDGNLFELAWAFERHNSFLDEFVPLTFVGNHDVTRLASRLVDARHLPHALVLLFTCGGTPSIYAGDEQAFRGVKENRVGGDDAVRPAFPAIPADLAPYGWATYRLHQRLIGLRRRHPWLHGARNRLLHLTNKTMLYEARSGEHSLLVALNLGDRPSRHFAPGASRIIAGEGGLVPDGTDAQIQLPAHGWAILAP